MCGHLSLFNLKPLHESEKQLVRKSISPRGPDDYQSSIGNDFEIFHSRLAIQESIEHDVQPYVVDNRYILVYNGEIYNYVELREYLKSRGLRFLANGDTEVLARGLALEGIAWLSRLNGMYSFVFYDTKEKSVIAARDRLGVKPLYYTVLQGGLALSTNSWCLSQISKASLDEEKIDEILLYRYEIGISGVYKNILSLEPGHYLTWKKGEEVKKVSYWDQTTFEQDGFRQKKFEETLHDSIHLRVRSKVPMTALLSGGIDSSYLVLRAKELSKISKVYTLNLNENSSDVNYAKKLCRDVGLGHELIELGSETWFDNWDEALVHLESPVLDTIIGPTNLIFKKISKDYKVVFSGEGADEILGGYVHHALLRKIKIVTGFSRIKKEYLSLIFPLVWRLSKKMSPYPGRFGEVERRKLRAFLSESDPKKSYQILISIGTSFQKAPPKEFDKISSDSLEEFLNFDLKHWLPNYTLRRLDAISSAYGVEARVPYLDYRLVEMMIKGGFQNLRGRLGDKRPLRQAHLSHYKEHGLWRNKKTPFVLSSSDYLNSETKAKMLERLEEDQNHSSALREFCETENIFKKLKSNEATSPLEEKALSVAYLMGRWLAIRNEHVRQV